jgi:hypothetical protein
LRGWPKQGFLILWFVTVIGLPRRDLLEAVESRMRYMELRLEQIEVIQFGKPQRPPFDLRAREKEKLNP